MDWSTLYSLLVVVNHRIAGFDLFSPFHMTKSTPPCHIYMRNLKSHIDPWVTQLSVMPQCWNPSRMCATAGLIHRPCYKWYFHVEEANQPISFSIRPYIHVSRLAHHMLAHPLFFLSLHTFWQHPYLQHDFIMHACIFAAYILFIYMHAAFSSSFLFFLFSSRLSFSFLILILLW